MSHIPRIASEVNGLQHKLPDPGIDATRRRISLGFAAVVLAALPKRPLAEVKGVSMQSADKFARLSADPLIAPGRLTLNYSVTNLADSEIFIFNRMYDDIDGDGRYRVEKNVCNVEASAGQVVVSKKIPGVPPFMFVESPNIPCVTPIPAHATCSETFELQLPLKPWTPYSTVPDPVRLDKLPLFLEIAYFVGQRGTRALGKEVPTTAGLALRFAPFSIASQTTLRAGPFAAVEVLVGKV